MKLSLPITLFIILNFVMTICQAEIKIYAPRDHAVVQHPKHLNIQFMASSKKDIDQFVLVWDGQALMNCAHCETFRVSDPERGEHTLLIQALDSSGNVMDSSKTLSIMVHQPSILFKRQH